LRGHYREISRPGIQPDIQILVGANERTYLCGFVTHASWSDFGGEKDLFAWDARGAHRISTRLLISIGASRVNVAIAGAEGVECDGFGHLCGPVQTSVPKLPAENAREIPALRREAKRMSAPRRDLRLIDLQE
jgi:hypothetical protein